VEKLVELLNDIGLLLGALAIAVGVVEVHTYTAYAGVTRHIELVASPCLHGLHVANSLLVCKRIQFVTG
jgi:hypothetical protein